MRKVKTDSLPSRMRWAYNTLSLTVTKKRIEADKIRCAENPDAYQTEILNEALWAYVHHPKTTKHDVHNFAASLLEFRDTADFERQYFEMLYCPNGYLYVGDFLVNWIVIEGDEMNFGVARYRDLQ